MNSNWYQARLRWAVAVDRQQLRHWEESVVLLRSGEQEAAFEKALAIGRRREGGIDEDGRWVETRLADVVALDLLGQELPDELEVSLERLPATEPLKDGLNFDPERRRPQPSF